MASWRDGKKPDSGSGRKPANPRESAQARSSAKPSAPAPPAQTAGRKSWRGADAANQQDTTRWKKRTSTELSRVPLRAWIIGGTLVTAGLMVYLIILLLSRPSKTPLIVLGVLDYTATSDVFASSPFPPNAWAEEDLEHLAAVNTDNIDARQITDKQWTPGDPKDQLLAQLRKVPEGRPAGADSGVVLLYLSAHTALNAAREPCLLAADADPLDDSRWTRFSDFASEVRKIHPSVRKVVLLDCGRLGDDPALGVSGSFVEQAVKIVEDNSRNGSGNLWFLFSNGPNEQSWAAPELGGSAFGFFVAEGLLGRANSKTADKFVSLDELASFVSGNVDAWSRKNRGVSQRPVLVPDSATRFPLLIAKQGDQTPPKSRLADDERQRINAQSAKLKTAWGRLGDALRDNSPDTISSAVSGSLIRRLCQLEQRLLAGRHYRVTDDELTLSSQFSRLVIPPVTQQLPACSLPAFAWRGEKMTEEHQLLAGLHAAPLTQPLFRKAFEKVAVPQSSEAVFAWMLGEHADWSAGQSGLSAAAAAALRCRQAAELAACPCERTGQSVDLRYVPWVKPEIADLDTRRRLMEDRLFTNDWDGLEQEFQTLTASYQGLTERALAVRDASFELERGLRLLIDVSRWPQLLRTGAESPLNVLNDRLKALRDVLDSSPPQTAALAPARVDLQRARDEVIALVRKNISDAERQLSSSETNTESRLQLAWTILQTPSEMLGALHDLARLRFIEGAFEARPIELNAKFGDEALARLPQHVGFHFESEWFALLTRPASSPATAPTPQTNIRLALQQADRQFQTLADERGIDTPPTQFASAIRLAQVLCVGRDFADRVFPPTSERASQPSEAAVRAAIQKRGVYEYMAWQINRVIDDFWGPPSRESDAIPFFVAASNRLLTQAREQSRIDESDARKLQQLLEQRQQAVAQGLAGLSASDVVFDQDSGFPLEVETDVTKDWALKVTTATDGRQVPAGRPEGLAALWIENTAGANVPLGAARRHSFNVRATEAPPIQASVGRDWQSGRARALFRGHLASAPFKSSRIDAAWTSLEWKAPAAAKTSIFVGDSRQDIPVIYFVLDCSGSMLTPDVIGADGNHDQRWKAAVGSLQDTLRLLSQRYPRKFQVGLIAFGHRFGFGIDPVTGKGSTKYPLVSTIATRRALEAPRSLREVVVDPALQGMLDGGASLEEVFKKALENRDFLPSLDVEELVRPLPLGQDEVTDNFAGLLGELNPTGQTPLYHAIATAVRKLDGFRDQPREIIVISDGMNDLIGGWSLRGTPTFADLENSDPPVIRTLAKRGGSIGLTVIGIGKEFEDAKNGAAPEKSGGNADPNQSYKHLESIATIIFARDRQALSQNLERLLSPIMFQIVTPEGVELEPRKLGDDPLVLDRVVPGDYLVKLLGSTAEASRAEKRLLLEGGEQIQLMVDRPRTSDPHDARLRFRRYGNNVDQDDDGPDGYARTFEPIKLRSPWRPFTAQNVEIDKPLVAVHQPDIYGQTAIIPVSISASDFSVEPENVAFSPRPALIWIQAIPQRDEGNGEPPVQWPAVEWFQREFLPGRPVPVIPVRVPQFPREATQCQFNVAFSYGPNPETVHISELKNGPLPAVDGCPDVNFQLRIGKHRNGQGIVVVLSELQPGPQTGPSSAMVSMSPEPDRIVRRLFKNKSQIDHEFYFESETAALPTDARLSILSRARFLERAAEVSPKPVKFPTLGRGRLSNSPATREPSP